MDNNKKKQLCFIWTFWTIWWMKTRNRTYYGSYKMVHIHTRRVSLIHKEVVTKQKSINCSNIQKCSPPETIHTNDGGVRIAQQHSHDILVQQENLEYHSTALSMMCDVCLSTCKRYSEIKTTTSRLFVQFTSSENWIKFLVDKKTAKPIVSNSSRYGTKWISRFHRNVEPQSILLIYSMWSKKPSRNLNEFWHFRVRKKMLYWLVLESKARAKI